MESCVCTLIRQDAKHQWGFSLQGGRDYGRSLTIQKINPRSIAEQRGLRLGDTILQIGRERTVDMSHQNAQDAIIRSGNRLDLIVLRPISQPDKRLIQQEKHQEKITSVVHKQHYNSLLPLYSTQNIADTLATQAKVLTNGTISVTQRTMSAPAVKRTEVYRTVHTEEEDEEEEEEEEEEEGKWGVVTGHQSISRNVAKSPILQSQSFLRLQRSLEESETSSSAASSPSASPTYMKRQVAAPQPPPKPVPARNEVQSPQYDQYQKQQQQQYYYQQQQQVRQQQVVQQQQQQPPRQSPQQQVLLQQQRQVPQQQPQQQRQPPQQQQRQVPQQQPQQQQRQPPQQQPQQRQPQQQQPQQRQPQQQQPQQRQPQQQQPQQQQRQVPQQQQQRQPPQQQQPQQRQQPQQQQRQQQQPVARPQTQQHQQQATAPSSANYNNVSTPKTGSTFLSNIPTETYPTQGGGGGQPIVTWSPTMGRKPVWPPQKSQEALSTSSQSVKWRGGTPSKKFIWPPPKDYVEVNEEYENGHVHTVYKEAPSYTARNSRVYVSPRAPARLAAQAWEPYSQEHQEESPHLGSGPSRRLRRFNDIFIPNSTRLPPTYRAPPGTQHVEFAYE